MHAQHDNAESAPATHAFIEPIAGCPPRFARSRVALALAGALGISNMGVAQASNIAGMYGTWQGVFSLLDANGVPIQNMDAYNDTRYYGQRTPVTGNFYHNQYTGEAHLTMNAFSFAGGGLMSLDAQAPDFDSPWNIQHIGDGMGGSGTLAIGNMSFDWSGHNGIPVSIAWDLYGFYLCSYYTLNFYHQSQTCAGTGALAASENTVFKSGRFTYTLPLGAAPIATTTWNTSTIGGTSCGLGCNPSGTLPLITDTTVDTRSNPTGDIGIGGSPMVAGPFPGWNINLDILSLHIEYRFTVPDGYEENFVPIPAAAWLFGSGLLGLLGVARRQLQQRRR